MFGINETWSLPNTKIGTITIVTPRNRVARPYITSDFPSPVRQKQAKEGTVKTVCHGKNCLQLPLLGLLNIPRFRQHRSNVIKNAWRCIRNAGVNRCGLSSRRHPMRHQSLQKIKGLQMDDQQQYLHDKVPTIVDCFPQLNEYRYIHWRIQVVQRCPANVRQSYHRLQQRCDGSCSPFWWYCISWFLCDGTHFMFATANIQYI